MKKEEQKKEERILSRTSIYLSRPKQKEEVSTKQTRLPRKHRLPANRIDNSL